MIRKRLPKLLIVLATAACLFGVVLVTPAETPTLSPVSPLPTANAVPVGNGYDITYTQANDNQTTCVIAGCPRVYEDLAGDSINYTINGGEQNNIPKACGNTTTVTVNSGGPFTLAFQGCRGTGLFDTNSGSCGAWVDYRFEPPVKAPTTKKCDPPADFERAEVGINEQCVAKPKPPVKCEPAEDFEAPEVPFGQQCKKLADVANAIQASFGDTSGSPLEFNVTNSSRLEAKCDYKATTNSLNPLVPRTTTRTFNVPANGNHTETFDGVPTLSNYNVTLTCLDASGKQKAPIGTVNTTVRW